MNTKRNMRTAGIIMLIVAACFLIYALGHPEMSFPWDNMVTYTIYYAYLTVMTLLFIAQVRSP